MEAGEKKLKEFMQKYNIDMAYDAVLILSSIAVNVLNLIDSSILDQTVNNAKSILEIMKAEEKNKNIKGDEV